MYKTLVFVYTDIQNRLCHASKINMKQKHKSEYQMGPYDHHNTKLSWYVGFTEYDGTARIF
jgi:hypothetical protein